LYFVRCVGNQEIDSKRKSALEKYAGTAKHRMNGRNKLKLSVLFFNSLAMVTLQETNGFCI